MFGIIHKLVSLCTALFLCIVCSYAKGQQADYRSYCHVNLGTDASFIGCFLQDTQGLMWIGSNKGLFSYDGYSAQPHFDIGHFSNTRINCGSIVDSTYLYLGADNGLLIYNYLNDTYEDTEGCFPKDIRALSVYDGQVWLGTLNGLYVYSPSSRKLSPPVEGIPHQAVYSLLRASDGCLYVGTYNGCCRYVPSTGHIETVHLPIGSGRSNLFVNSMLEDSIRKCIWIGMEGCLLKYSMQDGTCEQINEFQGNSVKSLAWDGNGQLLVGTDNGLYVYSDHAPLRHIVHDSRNPQSLANNIIWTIFTDREQNVWLGTDYGASMSRNGNRLRYLPISLLTKNGEGNQFYSILRDKQGTVWLGGTNGLIRLALPAGETLARTQLHVLENFQADVAWYKMGNHERPLSHNRVRQLYEDRDGMLWVATDGSVSRYDDRERRFIHYNIVDSTRRYNANWAYNLFEDNSGNLWIATCLGGLFVVDKRKLTQEPESPIVADRTYTLQNGLSGMFINQIVPDNKGNVWLLLYNSPNSIEKINIHTGEITHAVPNGIKDGQTPSFILGTKSGDIWIGFPGGVMRVSPSDYSEQVLPFGAYNRDEVLSMAEAAGMIWISTTGGLWVADQRKLTLKRLNITDKRFTSMFYDEENDEIYLGTVDGLSVSSPADLLEGHPDYPILLSALRVNNQPYQPEQTDGAGSIRYARSISLEHHQNNLIFELSDLPYSLEEKNKFVYRLKGIEDDWNVLPSSSNKIIYNNLRYGNYRLEVNKLAADGVSPVHPYALDVTISPPWYYAWWAKTLYAAFCVILILWTINFFRVKNSLKLARIEKENILQQSRAKIEFFTNLSHDLKTPLSMIIAPISKLLPNVKDPQAKKQLAQVHRNAMKLNSLIHQGLDLNRVDSGKNTLSILSQVELVSFARDIFSLYAEEKAAGKQLVFDFRSNETKIYVQADAIKLESILDNLLSNAIKFSLEGGHITLQVNWEEGGRNVSITVADTGIGIPQQDQPYVFQRFFQSPQTADKKEGTGIGLYLVKTYAELHGGSVRLSSEANKGTELVVLLPIVDAEQTQAAKNDPDKATEETVEETFPDLPDTAPTVLIVEDHAEVAEFIIQVLQARYRCFTAENGKQGCEQAMKLLPDLIISDVMMPVMDGLEMVHRLKKHVPTSAIPIILLTAKTDKNTELESIRLHVDAFITKPFEPDILLLRVEQLLSVKQEHEAKIRMELLSAPKEIEAVSYDEKFLADVTRLIEEHLAESELNVNALCEWAGVPNKQMYRKIKSMTGMTPVEYIKSIRMKKAAMLLRQHKFSVAEVMYMVGFSNHSYFSKCFQNAFGVTPKQY